MAYVTLDWITISRLKLCRMGTQPKFPLNDLTAPTASEPPLPSFEVLWSSPTTLQVFVQFNDEDSASASLLVSGGEIVTQVKYGS